MKISALLRSRTRWIFLLGLAVVATLVWLGLRPAEGTEQNLTIAAKRGPLDIHVLVGGSVEALESQELLCEVRGEPVKILKIVEEGYQVTEDDVKNHKILAELDSSKLKQNFVSQEITFQGTLSGLTEAQQSYEIQVNQNKTDIKAAEQKARFALMDLEKYMGAQISREIVARLGLSEEVQSRVPVADAVLNVESPAGTNLPSSGSAVTNISSSSSAVKDISASSSRTTSASFSSSAVTNIASSNPAAANTGSSDSAGKNIASSNSDAVNTAAVQSTANKTTSIDSSGTNSSSAMSAASSGTVAQTSAAKDGGPDFDTSNGTIVITAASINSGPAAAPTVDFAQYVRDGLLEDGMAKQELRKREDELLVAKTALSQAQTKYDWTKQLTDKGYVTKSELETDQNSAEQARLRVEAAITAVDLFKKYEFPKMAEEALGKYDEALQGLIRARKEAVSRLAQAEAKLKGAQGRYQIEKQNRDELADQIKSCQLCAKTPGLVVYGGGSDRNYWGNNERIAVGSQVYERQPIITIPDQTKMGVNVGVHESHVMKVKKGQKVKITADAFPDEPLAGEVIKVGVLPDSQNRWMNPDLKLYSTRIAIQGTRDWVKPGMSAKIEIQVKRLDDVIYVPLQAVSTREGKQVVFRPGHKPEPIAVEVGEFNDEFIEIKSGLANGDLVLLRAPDSEKPAANDKKSPETKPEVKAESETAKAIVSK